MADYGLKVFKSDGSLRLNLTDVISRLRYSTVASADSSSSVSLPDIDGHSTVEIGIALRYSGYVWQVPHHVYRSGTTIYWDARGLDEGDGQFASSDTLVLVFLYS